MNGKTYAVVYQMGKVASTSLVATLNKGSEITAVQSHFLGVDALRDILPSMVSSSLGDYFYAHQFGQFKINVEVTRRINMILDGQNEERLLILSMSRDPLDWFRSSLVQDMEAYAPQFIEYAGHSGLVGKSDDETVCAALSDCIQHFVNILEQQGGIDAHFEKRKEGFGRIFIGTPLENRPPLQRVFHMMLRPYNWFEEHFERAMKLKVSAFNQSGSVYTYTADRADYVILRYEDIQSSFIPAMKSIGLLVPSKLAIENTSVEKPFSRATRRAFSGEAGLALSVLAKNSRYAHRFAY